MKADGTLYKQGEYMKRPQLANTLERIALLGGNALYEGSVMAGSLAEDLLKDLQEHGKNAAILRPPP